MRRSIQIVIGLMLLVFSLKIYAGNTIFTSGCGNQEFVDTAVSKYANWQNSDLRFDKMMGISTEKAYNELLNNKKSHTVIVAVIDAGIDINHPELREKIWVNNDEVAGNGLDDDNNGYIDDINGWNFLGNQYNENIGPDNLELTRLIRKYAIQFDSIPTKENLKEHNEYLEYIQLKDEFDLELKDAKDELESFKSFKTIIETQDSILMDYFGKPSYTIEDIKEVSTKDKWVKYACRLFTMFYNAGFSTDFFHQYGREVESKVYFHLNPDFEARSLVGDNVDDIHDIRYGNNDVTGPYADHGTMVAGIIAANRDDGTSMKGIAGDVQIMALRVVPNGDEYDKDVALAIQYAVDNGAQIINMSFGKKLSPHKEFVDSAILYAERKQVLMVHAAGNEGQNIDIKKFYPNDETYPDSIDEGFPNTWINVGASDRKIGKSLPARFSNYGKNNVDVFAPGVDIYSLSSNGAYSTNSGTSCAAPVVTGMATVLKSYYPELNAAQLRGIIIESAQPVYIDVELPVDEDDPYKEKKKPTGTFFELSASGGVINLYKAILLAEKEIKKSL